MTKKPNPKKAGPHKTPTSQKQGGHAPRRPTETPRPKIIPKKDNGGEQDQGGQK